MKHIIFQLSILLFFSEIAFAQITLVRDFSIGPESTLGSSIQASHNDKAYIKMLAAEDSINVLQLWTSNGTSAGIKKLLTVPLSDPFYSNAFFEFTPVNSTEIAFVAANSDTLYEIYISDGITIRKVASTTKYIYGMKAIGNDLFYTSSKESSSYTALNKVNLETLEFNEISEFDTSFEGIEILNNTLIFIAQDKSDYKIKVYTSDGTSEGTIALADVSSGSIVSQKTVLTNAGDKVFFFYKEPGSDCCNFLWVTDGTESGTKKLREFNMIDFLDYSSSEAALGIDGKFYFQGVDKDLNSNNERVLWVSDGTANGTIALNSSDNFTKPHQLTLFKNKIYFSGYSGSSFNYELYETDGTVSGTKSVDVEYNDAKVHAGNDIAAGDRLYFSGYQNATGSEIFSYDGLNSNVEIHEGITGFNGSEPEDLTYTNNILQFFATTPETGNELYTLGITTGINSSKFENIFSIAPNPATNVIYINSPEKINTISISDSKGATQINEVSPSQIDVSNLENGFYIMTIKSTDGTANKLKLVISR